MTDLPMINPCGECTACCTALAVGEIGKAQNESCQHICEQGCSIYETRPASCRKYECIWLYSQSKTPFPPEWRPDRLGAVIEGTITNAGPVIVVRELHPGAADEEKVRQVYTYLSSLSKGSVMVVHPDNAKTILLPRAKSVSEQVSDLFIEKPDPVSAATSDPRALKRRKKLLKQKMNRK
jgi:hypothetical protein